MVRWSTSVHQRAAMGAAGLASGPLAWVVATQLNLALVTWTCTTAHNFVLWTALVTIAFAAGGGWLSWLSWRIPERSESFRAISIVRPRRFIAGLGILSSLIFALTIALQGTAALVLNGCER